MSSRFMAGLGAWLLGTVTATTGSMVAVNVLAHHLLDPQTLQLGATAANADFDRATDRSHSPAVVSQSPAALKPRPPGAKSMHSATPTTSPSARPGAGSPPPSPAPSPSSASPPPNSAGTLLVSADGSVMATCESAGAYLLYWSPDQGFEADDVMRGPAAIASVVFQNRTSSIVMRVSCSNGKPVAQVGGDE